MLHGFTAVWHRSCMTTTEEKPSTDAKTDELPIVVTDTPIYDHTHALAIGEGFDPSRKPANPTGRQLAAAKRLTTQVWASICKRASTVDWSDPNAKLGEEDAGNDSHNEPQSGAA